MREAKLESSFSRSTIEVLQSSFSSVASSGGRYREDWIGEYAGSHQNRSNALTHLFGIPMVAASLPLQAVSLFVSGVWT